MAAEELKDRTDRLFGRVADVEHLLVRAQLTGLTAVVAPPLMGKSWLLAEVARRLATGAPQPFLVGYSRSPRGGRDRLLRVVSDLYQRWLGEARAWEQARMTWEQQKEGLLSRLAASVTKVAGKAAKTLGGEVVATAIEEAMGGLIAASDRLNNVGFAPPLDYDRALELVRGVHMVAKRRMALVLDQWEESPDLGAQIQVLRDFLRDREDWPPCHFFLGVREGTDGAAMVEELLRDHGAPSDTYPLGDMELDDAETRRLLDRLRAPLPGIWDVDDAAVVDLTGGYPGVVAFWLDENNAGRIGTLDGLRQSSEAGMADQDQRNTQQARRQPDGPAIP